MQFNSIALYSLAVIRVNVIGDLAVLSFLRVIVQSMLMYGATAWTLTNTFESRLDHTYTRIALNLSWRHPTKQRLCGSIPPRFYYSSKKSCVLGYLIDLTSI